MEFTTEVKNELIEQINTLKRMLDKLSEEINEIEDGVDLEFIVPISTAGSICNNMKSLKQDLIDWKDEGFVDQNVFGE